VKGSASLKMQLIQFEGVCMPGPEGKR
jgi:hypothetical protein